MPRPERKRLQSTDLRASPPSPCAACVRLVDACERAARRMWREALAQEREGGAKHPTSREREQSTRRLKRRPRRPAAVHRGARADSRVLSVGLRPAVTLRRVRDGENKAADRESAMPRSTRRLCTTGRERAGERLRMRGDLTAPAAVASNSRGAGDAGASLASANKSGRGPGRQHTSCGRQNQKFRLRERRS